VSEEPHDEQKAPERTAAVSITAAVLDTSFGTAGNFDADRVKALADRLSARRIELWVPQQVIWEWAAHAHEGWEKIRRDYRKLVLGGFASDESKSAADDLVAALTERVNETGVSVLSTHGSSAIQAIRDQILGTGPGRKNDKGVRTGASDSAWIRDALEEAQGKVRKIAFLSGNARDVLSTTRAMGFADSEVLVVPNERELFEMHIARVVKASLEVTRRVTDMLVRRFEDARGQQAFDTHDLYPPWFESSDLDIGRDVTERDEWGQIEFKEGVEIGVPQPQVIEITNVQIDFADEPPASDGARSVTFDLTLLGGVILNGFTLEDTGSVAFNENYIGDVLISLPCVVSELSEGEFAPPRQTDTGSVSSALARFDDQVEALTWTLESLGALEHIELERSTDEASPDDIDGTEDGAVYVLRGPAGRTERVELSRDPFDAENEWELQFQNSKLEVRCTYDHGATAWFEGDAYDLYPPYSVHSPSSREPFSAFAAVWRYLIREPG